MYVGFTWNKCTHGFLHRCKRSSKAFKQLHCPLRFRFEIIKSHARLRCQEIVKSNTHVNALFLNRTCL